MPTVVFVFFVCFTQITTKIHMFPIFFSEILWTTILRVNPFVKKSHYSKSRGIWWSMILTNLLVFQHFTAKLKQWKWRGLNKIRVWLHCWINLSKEILTFYRMASLMWKTEWIFPWVPVQPKITRDQMYSKKSSAALVWSNCREAVVQLSIIDREVI